MATATKTPAKTAAAKPSSAVTVEWDAEMKSTSVVDELGDDLLSMSQVWLTHTEVKPDRQNLRQQLTEIDELADSIASVGLLEPLHVTLMCRPEDLIAGSNWYWLVAGHRRHAAIGKLIADGRWPATRRIPCVVGPDPALSEEARTVAQLIENLQRVDLNPIEEAHGYRRLVEAGWKQTRIADTIGRHQNRVSERMQLLKLPDVWQAGVAAGEISLGIAAALAGLTAGAMEILLKEKRTLDKHYIDSAIQQDRRETAISKTKANAAARDLKFLQKQSWEMDGYVRVIETTPDGLAKVLLPADIGPLGAVTIETYSSTPKVTVWRPQTAGSLDDDDGSEKTPHQLWEAECARLRKEHQAAERAYNERKDEATIEWARSVDTKVVAQALMHKELANSGSREPLAKQFGWKPPAGATAEEKAVSLDEWYSHAANFSAAIAKLLLNGYYTPPSFLQLRQTHLDNAGLGQPPVLTLPGKPGAIYCTCEACAASDVDERCEVDEPGQKCTDPCCDDDNPDDDALVAVTEGDGGD
jgi:ParB/RepB/Spo0J family partition protein